MNPFRSILLCSVLFFVPYLGAADDINAVTPKKIGTADAAKHYNEMLTVTGKVAQVTIRPKVVFLNIDQAFPDSPFTGVIFPGATNKFGELLPMLEGKAVELTGTITNFHDKPEIVLTNAAQLKVIGPSGTDKK